MVREFGLSASLGPVGYPSGGSAFLGDGGAFSSRPFAEATQAAIDTEVANLLRQAENRAVELLKGNRGSLDSLVDLLLERETVDGDRRLPAIAGRCGPLADPVGHDAGDGGTACRRRQRGH